MFNVMENVNIHVVKKWYFCLINQIRYNTCIYSRSDQFVKHFFPHCHSTYLCQTVALQRIKYSICWVLVPCTPLLRLHPFSLRMARLSANMSYEWDDISDRGTDQTYLQSSNCTFRTNIAAQTGCWRGTWKNRRESSDAPLKMVQHRPLTANFKGLVMNMTDSRLKHVWIPLHIFIKNLWSF